MQNLKLINTQHRGIISATAKVYQDLVNGGYIVQIHQEKQHLKGYDFETDDKSQALIIAGMYLSELAEQDE